MFLMNTKNWYLERIVWLVAGLVVLTSLILSQVHSPYWLILTGLVGLNLVILSLTGFCPLTVILYKFGVPAYCKKD